MSKKHSPIVVPSVGPLGLVVVSFLINSDTEVVRILWGGVQIYGLVCSGHSIGKLK